MNLYRTDYFVPNPNEYEYHNDPSKENIAKCMWHGTLADAAKFRKEIKQQVDEPKLVLTTTVNVPTNKTGLLEFLNQHS